MMVEAKDICGIHKVEATNLAKRGEFNTIEEAVVFIKATAKKNNHNRPLCTKCDKLPQGIVMGGYHPTKPEEETWCNRCRALSTTKRKVQQRREVSLKRGAPA